MNINRNTEHNIIEQQRKKYCKYFQIISTQNINGWNINIINCLNFSLFSFLVATNKDSYDQLIAKVKHDNSPQKIFVRRNILKENSDISCKDHIAENDSPIKDGQIIDFLPLNSINNDEDSNTFSPSQTYFDENTMNFLTIELGSSSNESTDQCVSNHDISNRLYETSLDSFNSTINLENIKTEKLSSENVLIHEEITSNNRSRQCDVLGNKTDIDTKKSVSEFIKMETKNREQTKLSKRSRSGTNYNPYSELRDKWQKELRNEDIDLIVEDVDFLEDSDNIEIQDNYGK